MMRCFLNQNVMSIRIIINLAHKNFPNKLKSQVSMNNMYNINICIEAHHYVIMSVKSNYKNNKYSKTQFNGDLCHHFQMDIQ